MLSKDEFLDANCFLIKSLTSQPVSALTTGTNMLWLHLHYIPFAINLHPDAHMHDSADDTSDIWKTHSVMKSALAYASLFVRVWPKYSLVCCH